MKERYLPFRTKLESEYSEVHFIFGVEGGAYYFARKQDRYYIVADFGTLADILDEEDYNTLISEYEFTNKDECCNFINELINDFNNAQGSDRINIRLPEALL